MPISNQAIAGLYYFKTAQQFVDAAQSMIRKDVKTNDSFFISPTLNEIILREGTVKAVEIDKSKYFHISDDHALEAFEVKVSEDRDNLKKQLLEKTIGYVAAFDHRSLESVELFLSESFCLTDPATSISGKANALAYIGGIFEAEQDLSFVAKNILITDDFSSVIEFELVLGSKVLVGTDIIHWNDELLMTNMNAYLYEKSHG